MKVIIFNKNEHGFIFIHLIISIFILCSVLSFLMIAIRQYEKKIERGISEREERIEHRSKAYQAIALIAQDDPSVDYLNEPWNILNRDNMFDSEKIHCDVQDETSKFNLKFIFHEDAGIRKSYRKHVEQLLKGLKVSASSIHAIFEEVELTNSLENTSQLPAIQHVMDEMGLDLSLFLTVNSEGKLNINTASQEVLEVLLEGEDPFLVKEILKRREKTPYRSISEIKGVHQDILKFITVKSTHFQIQTWDKARDKKPRLTIALQRALGELKIRQWIEK
jgi:type II secretory pathway component PulK